MNSGQTGGAPERAAAGRWDFANEERGDASVLITKKNQSQKSSHPVTVETLAPYTAGADVTCGVL